MLVHHADAGRDGVGGTPEVHGLAVEEDLALVGPVQPEQDVHERRLAGAVLPEQGVDLSALDGEVHVLVGDDAREPLGDAAQLDPHGFARPTPSVTRVPSAG